jgi:transcriptional regulator with GAF, ATPase, and Fis domain
MPSMPNLTGEELAPETLVPRLGEYLLEKGLITARELGQALEYQKKKAANGQPRLLGQALMALGYIDRDTLDRVIVTQIFALHTALQEANRKLEQRVNQYTENLEKRLDQIHTSAEFAEVAISTGNLDELLKRTVELIIARLHFEHAAVFLLDDTGDFALLRAASGAIGQLQNLGDYRLPIGSPSIVSWVASQNQLRIIKDANQEPLFAEGAGHQTACTEAGIPISLNDKLLGVLHVQHHRAEAFDNDAITTLQTIANLIASFTYNQRQLEAAQLNLKVMEKRLSVLETLDLVNKTISAENDLDSLFRLIHEQINKVIGSVDLLIALYSKESNTIEIPFAVENGVFLNIPPFPMGQGLTSIVIQSKKPLLLVKDVEFHAKELGARFVGKPAKSWLGAPLLVGGEAIGAIVIQDLNAEQRFDEDDQRLLSNLATQVAITVRNVFQIETAQAQAVRERIAADISAKLWASTDIHTILQTAILELSQRLGATEGTIHLQVSDDLEVNAAMTNNGNKGGTL